jgi:uncharacterized membrane protein YbhN (UPF0104 family)
MGELMSSIPEATPTWTTASRRAPATRVRMLVVTAMLVLAAWFVVTHRGEVVSVRHGLASSNPWTWPAALVASVALAVATGGVVRHAMRAAEVPLSLSGATRLALAGHFLCTLIPFGGMAGAPLFMTQSARRTGRPAAGAAGFLLTSIVGRVALELTVVLSLPLLAAAGVPLALVLVALALHVGLTLAKVTVIGASRRHESTFARWIAGVRSRVRRLRDVPPSACPSRQIVGHFAAVRWRNTDLRRALAWSLAAKLIGGVLVVISVRAAGGSLAWTDGTTVYAAATLVGAVSFLPAGLGAVDLTIGHALVADGMTPAQAATAVVFYRVFQLWIPLVLGGVFAARFGRRVTSGTVAPVGSSPGVVDAASAPSARRRRPRRELRAAPRRVRVRREPHARPGYAGHQRRPRPARVLLSRSGRPVRPRGRVPHAGELVRPGSRRAPRVAP